MDKKELLCFCLPTCNKEDMFKFLLPSLINIGELKNYCCFGIIFQPPYTEEDVKYCLTIFDELGLNYIYEFKKYDYAEGETPLIRMRNDCALKYPKALFYAMLDDDMSFLPGIDKDYLNILNYMLEHRNISVANLFPPMPVDNQTESEDFDFGLSYNDFENADYFTSSGIIYRGGIYYGFDGLLPTDMLNLVGGRQDILMAIWRVLQGDSSIKLENGHCEHYENRSSPGCCDYNWLSSTLQVCTCTSWLEQQGYIAHILHSFGRKSGFYQNFSKEKCEELYKKGCISSYIDYLERLQGKLFSLNDIKTKVDSNLFKLEENN